jgi:ABC-type polysaccharide/polyol phosphate export permease
MLGYFWYLLEPLLQTLILYIVFGLLLGRGDMLFVLHILIGIMVWQWFEASLCVASLGIKNHLGIHNTIKLPLFVYPSVILLSQLWKLVWLKTIIIVFAVFLGFYPNFYYLHLPIVLFVAFSFIASVALTLSLVVTYFPDFLLFVSSILRLTFFFSGIFFYRDVVPENLLFYFVLNPVALVMDMFRNIIILGISPNYKSILYCMYLTFSIAFVYFILYYRCKNSILKVNTV